MTKFIKKHYMPILTMSIFISVFLYQFFNLVTIPVIETTSQQEINYLQVLSFLLVFVPIVTIIYNILLIATSKISITVGIYPIRIQNRYQNFYINYQSLHVVTSIYKTHRVIRC